MHGLRTSNEAGSCTIKVTFCAPLPSSLKAMYSVPATLPSAAVTTPAEVTFGPYRLPKPPAVVVSRSER